MAQSQISDEAVKKAQVTKDTAQAGEAQTNTEGALIKQYAPVLAQSAQDYPAKLQAFETLHPDLKGRFPSQFNAQQVMQAGMTPAEISQQSQAKKLAEYHEANENYRAQLGKQTTFQNTLMQHGLNDIDKYTADPQHGYGQFVSQANSLKSSIQGAKDGNQLAASLEPMMLSLGVSSFAGVHRINTAEIDRAGPAVGSVFRKLNNLITQVGEGKPSDTQLNEASQIVDQLTAARHNAYIQGVSAVAANSGLDPSKIQVFDRSGNLAPLKSLQGKAQTTAPDAPSGFSVGSTIIQNGHKYKVTAVDKSGNPTAADPL